MITQEELKKLLYYEDGELIYVIHPKGLAKKGDSAGTLQPNGYKQVMIKRKRYYLHRLIWLYHHGQFPKAPNVLDHINRDKTDSRIENLRVVDRRQNAWNTTIDHRTKSKTGYRGVCYLLDRDRFLAYMYDEGKFIHIGHFMDPHTAAEAYNEKVQAIRGEYAALNTVEKNVTRCKLPPYAQRIQHA